MRLEAAWGQPSWLQDALRARMTDVREQAGQELALSPPRLILTGPLPRTSPPVRLTCVCGSPRGPRLWQAQGPASAALLPGTLLAWRCFSKELAPALTGLVHMLHIALDMLPLTPAWACIRALCSVLRKGRTTAAPWSKRGPAGPWDVPARACCARPAAL